MQIQLPLTNKPYITPHFGHLYKMTLIRPPPFLLPLHYFPPFSLFCFLTLNMPPNVIDLPSSSLAQKTIVVVGFGMAAVAFMEKVIAYDTEKEFCIKVFGDEPERKLPVLFKTAHDETLIPL